MRAHPVLALLAVWLLYAGVAFAATPFCEMHPASSLCRAPGAAGFPSLEVPTTVR